MEGSCFYELSRASFCEVPCFAAGTPFETEFCIFFASHHSHGLYCPLLDSTAVFRHKTWSNDGFDNCHWHILSGKCSHCFRFSVKMNLSIHPLTILLDSLSGELQSKCHASAEPLLQQTADEYQVLQTTMSRSFRSWGCNP